jgi:hypothetical protein
MKNTDIRSFDLTQRTIFGLLSQTLFGAAYTPEPDVDWTEVYRESENQAVRLQTFANHHLIPGIPDELREEIRRYLAAAMLRNARIHGEHTSLHRLLSENHVPYSILKGTASASYYANPLTRAMGDVDFYVDPADRPRVTELLRENGYTVQDYDGADPHAFHLAVKKDHIHMELHYQFPGVPDLPVAETLSELLSDMREKAVLMQNGLTTCMQPSAFHHGLIMLMHLQQHLLNEGIGLRHLCDWAVFVHHFSGDEFVRVFENKLKSVGLWRLARLLSLSAVLYIGLSEQSWMRENPEDEETARQLMIDIVAGGNFGRKDRQRAFEAKFIGQQGKKDSSKSRLAKAISAVNESSRVRWPIMKRCPLLLPFGWIYSVCGYLIHNRQRRKKGKQIRILHAYQKSEARGLLYDQLHIYDPET